MRNGFGAAFAIGLAVIAVAVGAMLYMQRGAHMALPGKILRVRTIGSDGPSSVALIDLEFTNSSDYLWIVREISATFEDGKGNRFDGRVASLVDAQRLFDASGSLGSFNPPLGTASKIPAHRTESHTLAVQFDVPESVLQARKHLRVQIDEVNGSSFEFTEK